VPDLTSLRRGK